MTSVRGRGIPLVAALIGALFATSCGQTHQTRVFSSHFVQRSDLERYPPDTPARASLELVRVLQFNDPTAAARFFTGPRRPTPTQIRTFLQRFGAVIQGTGVPKVVTVVRRGKEATVSALILGRRATLLFNRVGASWKLTRYRVGTFTGPPGPPRLVQQRDIERYPPDSPARAALELLRAMQHGQASVAATFVTRSWRLTPQLVARYRSFARDIGMPRIVSVASHGSRGTVAAFIRTQRVSVALIRTSGRWKIAQGRVGSLRLPRRP
jgi:hypothetical protein